jgi:DNA-binding SARP family transcriptional activator
MGRVMLESPDRVIEASALPGRQGRLAFVYLSIEPRRVSRDELAEAIWTDLPAAWESALASIMSKLRKTLVGIGLTSNVLDGSDSSYELRWPAGTWVDMRTAINALDRAEGALAGGHPQAAWSDATVASSFLRRHFLSGESGDWVERVRRDLHEYEIRTFDLLSRIWLELGNPGAALQAARRVVDLAPYRESAHARIMECHLAAGNRAEAIHTFDNLRRMLADSLGISAGPAAESLYEQALR